MEINPSNVLANELMESSSIRSIIRIRTASKGYEYQTDTNSKTIPIKEPTTNRKPNKSLPRKRYAVSRNLHFHVLSCVVSANNPECGFDSPISIEKFTINTPYG